MSSFNETVWSPSDGNNDGPSLSNTVSPGATPRPPISRRESRNTSNWPEASPLHHNEGTSYFQQGRVSPTLSRRMQNTPSTSAPISYQRPGSSASHRHSRSQHRSASVSSARRRRRDAVVSEEEEDDNELHYVHGGRRTPIANLDDASSSDDPEAEHARATDTASEAGSLDPVTLKERQSLINVEHPFGLPIWKPALYKKSRTVTRDAEHALHSDPSAAPELHLLPGNVLWSLFFGWWLALVFFVAGAFLFCIPSGGRTYGKLVCGLGWYLFWPFGRYLEGNIEAEQEHKADDNADDNEYRDLRGSVIQEDPQAEDEEPSPLAGTIRGRDYISSGVPLTAHSTITPQNVNAHPVGYSDSETTPLLPNGGAPLAQPISSSASPAQSYGATPLGALTRGREPTNPHFLSTFAYFIIFLSVVAPIMLLVTLICWALVFTIPMAKLNWELLGYLFWHPLGIHFRTAPPSVIIPPPVSDGGDEAGPDQSKFTVKRPRLRAGQMAPGGGPQATVLLCIYRAVGSQYYKYTVGGVNILFVNLMPVVFFVILDNFVLLNIKDGMERDDLPVNPFLGFIASRAAIFSLSLASVIPLSYFIGMAVASISAQSSIGMGAVINATFGSIIEIILYAIALESGKGRLVEGSIVGSLLAGVLLMPGVSMVAGALRKKEQRFNAKSAGVTSTMLIMAIIGTLTPTLFYQTFGEFTLICEGCPAIANSRPWRCRKCYYEHLDPAIDPFYQETVKSLMYLCASVLILSYLIGLWFSLRTHASQIWQNPQQLMQPIENLSSSANRMSLYNKLLPIDLVLPTHQNRQVHRQSSTATITRSRSGSALLQQSRSIPQDSSLPTDSTPLAHVPSPSVRRVSHAPAPVRSESHSGFRSQQPSTSAASYIPIVDSVTNAIRDPSLPPIQLPPSLTADDFTRAVAVATVSALRHQQNHEALRPRGGDAHEAAHGGHDAPSWSRLVSASVLLGCTVLYAIIAEILVDVVDVVLEGSGIDEKFLGVTLFALVPNTTEFMNAISFALHDNIALSMEIGSAYALQVCLLQIPAMVAFSAYVHPSLGSVADSFTLIFPRWDVIAIILSIFLLTYTYIEAKANYHRGSILVLSYVVLTAGFFFAPPRVNEDLRSFPLGSFTQNDLPALSKLHSLWV